jgi:replicative DNA helicase
MAQEGVRLLMGLVDSEKGFHKFLDYQFTESMFRGDESDLYGFIREHVGKYGKLPDRKTVKKWAKGEKIPLPVPEEIIEPPEFYYDKLEHRNLKLELLQAMKDAEQHRPEDPQQALEILSGHVLDLNTHRLRTKLVNIVEDGMTIVGKEFAKAVHGDDKGLMFGWPTLDEMSGGLRGGDLVSIMTLFVSMEMNSTPVVQRVVSMYTHTSIGELKTGQVSTKKYKQMSQLMDGLSGGHGMWVADGRLSVSVNDLALLCRQLQPDVVYIDGAYMLRSENSRVARYERINQNTEDVKILAEELNIPIVQTFQFNRGMTKKKEIEDVDLEDIAGSDAIGQLSSLVLGTFQDDNIETKLCRKIRVMKGRSGEQGEFLINWRFGGHGQLQDALDTDTSDIMNFTEIPTGIDSDLQFL